MNSVVFAIIIKGRVFVGFAKNSATAGQAVNIDFGALPVPVGGSFTTGAVYYLSDTPGALSLSQGTILRRVATAVSTTTLLRYTGAVTKAITIGASTACPVSGTLAIDFAGSQFSPTVDGVTFTNTRGVWMPVNRGSSFTSTLTPTFYFTVVDYGNII